MSGPETAQQQGEGRILGRPGVYHHAASHEYTPSRWYGQGGAVDALCGRTRGIVYADDTLANLFPEDHLCKFCARKAGA